MQFNSYLFVVFFAVVLVFHYAPGLSWTARRIALLLFSYTFYAAWDPLFVTLLWLSTFVDWHAAHFIAASKDPMRRRLLLLVSLTMNLGLLGYFKYGGFLLENVVGLAHLFGVDWHASRPDIVLPAGISFYTFQTLSYTMDVYFRRTEPGTSFLNFALYVTFFPQLVAGPIVRVEQFIPQCESRRAANANQFGWGLFLLVLGVFEKTVLADNCFAPMVDHVYRGDLSDPLGFADAWLGTIAFAGQIFCDFAGYSTSAIGTALCLGFSLPNNFLFPYAAIGFSDFWRRWHISLSTWLRDYLYIPLGGNRRRELRTCFNLMATMLIGGLWHGASWNFVVWGGLHGTYLVIERVLKQRIGELRLWTTWPLRFALGGLTFVGVCFAWVFFRAASFPSAARVIVAMLGAGQGASTAPMADAWVAGVACAILFVAHWLLRSTTLEERVEKTPMGLRVFALTAMLVLIAAMTGEDRAFIYFQF